MTILAVSELPIWRLDELVESQPRTSIGSLLLRIRFFEDKDSFAEFTVNELVHLYGYSDFSSFVKQYKIWHQIGAFEWLPEQRVNQEKIPQSDYMPKTFIYGGRVESIPPSQEWGIDYWGARRSPIEDWEIPQNIP